MSGGGMTLLLIAAFVVVGLGCVLRPPERLTQAAEQLLRRLGMQFEPTGEERQAAEQRARVLLRQMIGDADFERMTRRGYLDVPSTLVPGRIYRVPYFRGMVNVLEDGIATMQLCVVPTRWVPDPDIVIIHKLLIEGDEARYLRLANRFPAGVSRPITPTWWETARARELAEREQEKVAS